MNCEQARSLVEKLVDGEATERERASVQSHVARCEACRSEMDWLEGVGAALKASSEAAIADPGDGYWERLPDAVLARIASEEEPRAREAAGALRRAYPFLAVAASLLVAVTVVLVTREREPGALPATETAASPSMDSRAGNERAGDAGQTAARSAGEGVPGEVAPSPGIEQRAEAPADAVARADAGPASGSESRPEPGIPPPTATAEASRSQSPRAPRAREYANASPATPKATPTTGSDETAERDNERPVAALDDRAAGAGRAGLERERDPDVAELDETRTEEQTSLTESAPAAPSPSQSAPAAPAAQPAEPALARRSSAQLSTAAPSPCAALRLELSRLAEGSGAHIDKLYEIALCSIRRYDESVAADRDANAGADAPASTSTTTTTANLGRLAVRDIEAFLAVEAEGERADALERARERLQ